MHLKKLAVSFILGLVFAFGATAAMADHGAEGFQASASISDSTLTVSMIANAPDVRAAVGWYFPADDPMSTVLLFDEFLVGPGPLGFSGRADLSGFEPGTELLWGAIYYDPSDGTIIDWTESSLVVPDRGGPCGAYLPVVTTLDGNPARMGLELMYGPFDDPQTAGHPWVESGYDGRATFGCLPPGEYWVHATFGYGGDVRTGHTQRVVISEDLRIYSVDGTLRTEPLRAEVRWMLP